MDKEYIVEYALFLKKFYKTDDPFFICNQLNIETIIRDIAPSTLIAHTIKMENLPTIISINGKYDTISQKLLCAHELAHAIFHKEMINHFDSSNSTWNAHLEHEANLFAVALLFPLDQFDMDICHMSGYLLKYIIEYNLHIS